MSLYSESYHEYHADCSKCHSEILEIIEYADIKNFDDKSGVCSRCRKLFCGNCVIEKDDGAIYCPECENKLIEFWGCSPYDLIGILMHDCQLFLEAKKREA